MAVATVIKPLHSIHPGEWYFGVEYERLHTVLGSCVALTAWHPALKIGGMCHYLLAIEPNKKNTPAAGGGPSQQRMIAGDCRYANNALEQMKRSMQAYADMNEFQLGIFGGGDMFAYSTPTSIGFDNIAYARQWLIREKLKPLHVDVGGSISRSLMLVIHTGEIQLKHYQMNQP
ncbi:chemotaxis protein CheD [Cellvibrio fibrivorans]|uniref:Probable chemoreceptor glutamine deamidase CheD n=1 Tax=Cellvibrio fibrivorans TaxID=126350 RepID=A0ABU1V270_9GAMM|nr:chemotaxis protein CheD [Cellvibrio fibrivorans]MDR7091557.1 chemotaxis protein CheD [Cellvibrio fibrivorans]